MKSQRYVIKVSEEVYNELILKQRPGQTFDGVLREILALGVE